MFQRPLKHFGQVKLSKELSGVPTTHDDAIRALLGRKRFNDAFELAMSAYGNRMLGLAFSILGDRAQAEDAVQDVMVRIWRALPQFRGDSAFSTWAYAITRNRCLTLLKQRRGEESLSLDEPEARQAAAGIVGESAPASDVWALLGTLPLPYRQALTLFYAEEKSYEEIAQLLDMPIGTVKTHIHRGRKMLASLYAEARPK
jgi:RNA polymerase sigma-70 factor, ECF subfamily